MRRLFPILASIAGLLLFASLISGLVAPGPSRVPIAMLAGMTTVGVYAWASVSLAISGKQVSVLAKRLDLPDWVASQVEKNRRKAFAYQWWGLPFLMASVWSDVLLTDWAVHHGVSALNLAFQLGAFAGMFVILVAQERLLQDVQSWA
jgi:hypothetical protein